MFRHHVTPNPSVISRLARRARMVLAAAILAGALVATPTASRVNAKAPAIATRAALIYAGWFGNTIPTPSFVAANRTFLESQPFDGLVLYLRNASLTVNLTSNVMRTTAISYDTMMSVLSPIANVTFTNLRENLGLVQGSTPPDFFDDWSVVVQNYANLARAARDSGLKGLCFDNEQYAAPWGNYGSHLRYYASRSFADYQTQARLRGRQIMEAMVAEFPDIVFLTLHGPYISEPDAPTSLQFPQWQSGNELMGPFFAGHMEGAGTAACVMDGGELYTLRTLSHFQASRTWRRTDLPSDTVNCAFIPAALRSSWPGRSSISFGIYDRPFGGASMDATILRSATANALSVADRYVWFYSEANTYLLPSSQGGAASGWVDALRLARQDAGSLLSAPSDLSLQTVSSSQVSLSWRDNSSNETGFQLQKKVGTSGTWSALASLGCDTTSAADSNLTTGTTCIYRVQAVNADGASAWSNEVSTGAAPAPNLNPALAAAPSNLAATAVTTGSVTLGWTDNSTNENGFSIERLIGTTWTQIGWVADNVTTYTDASLIPGTAYSYRVLAFNGAGNSATTNPVTATTTSPAPTPAAPSDLVATAVTATSVTLGWTDNSSSENGFSIERLIGTTWTQIGWVPDNVTTYTKTGLSAGTAYSFRVLAFNGYGNSATTNVVGVTTTAALTIPAAPSGLTATVVSNTVTDLAWTDNSSNESGFLIERRRSGGTWSQVAAVGANVTTYRHGGRTRHITYVYRVRACNAAGNSAYCADARVTMP